MEENSAVFVCLIVTQFGIGTLGYFGSIGLSKKDLGRISRSRSKKFELCMCENLNTRCLRPGCLRANSVDEKPVGGS